MVSLNVPVDGRVKRLAADLRPRLAAFDRVRERHSLVCKRFESADDAATLATELRTELAATSAPAFEAAVTGVDYFETPLRGPGPVVYLVVESPGLVQLHHRLVERFGAVEGMEGDDYVPHVTLARGGSVDDADRLVDAVDVDAVTWTVSRLHLWDQRYRERVATIGLPA